MEREIEVGPTLGTVFQTYRDHAGVLLPIAFWLFLIVAIVNGLAGRSFALFPLVIVVGTIVGTLYQGIVVNLVRDVQDGRRDFSAGELINSTWHVVLPLIGAGLLSGIGIGIGLVLLVVPGLILLTIWAVIAPVIVVEHSGVLAAFGRSRELVRGNGWQVFGVILVAFLIATIAGFVFLAIANAIANGPIVRIVFSAIASTLTAPIQGLVAAVLYFSLLRIQGAQPPPLPPVQS
jgi:hypothetical protein